MKHTVKVTLILIAFFLLSQIIGLALLNNVTKEELIDGKRVVSYDESRVGEIPSMSGVGVFAYVLVGVGIGTGLLLLLIRLRKINIWKAWFFIAVALAIGLALRTVIDELLAFAIGIVLAAIKIFKPNIVIHNITEVFMYAGIACAIVPLLQGNVFWAAMLLVVISIYDFIAVFKSKHMVKMAEFQSESKVFAGLFVPYTLKSLKSSKAKRGADAFLARSAKASNAAGLSIPNSQKRFGSDDPSLERKNAVLGGGDIAFPLIFTGVVMYNLSSGYGLLKADAFLQCMVITAAVTIALTSLFFFAKKDKFYPAMPIISAGCFIGYGILLLIRAL